MGLGRSGETRGFDAEIKSPPFGFAQGRLYLAQTARQGWAHPGETGTHSEQRFEKIEAYLYG